MATSFPNFCFCNGYEPITKLTSTTRFSLPLSCPLLSGFNGISLHMSPVNSRTGAKFDKFQGDFPVKNLEEDITTPSTSNSLLQDPIEEEVYKEVLDY